ncbi:MAG: hypothetical protein BWY79_00679 [Actinobacteria bacterium ADurb.Bin444]|nr:MAG: hypothetical protein BWY79_00679 [Actinobacteria bacterium ADurb.Bin444]
MARSEGAMAPKSSRPGAAAGRKPAAEGEIPVGWDVVEPTASVGGVGGVGRVGGVPTRPP